MFSNMEGNADGTTIRKAQRDFDINLLAFHVFTKHPHLPHFVQSIHNWPIYIVLRLYVQDDLFADGCIDFQSNCGANLVYFANITIILRHKSTKKSIL